MTTPGPACASCLDESGGEYVGVAAVPGAPLSAGWCRRCLDENAVPRFVAETWLFIEFAANAQPIPDRPPSEDAFADWVKAFTVWIGGRYVPFVEAVPILWAEYER